MTIPLANKEAEQCAALDTLPRSSGSTGKIKFERWKKFHQKSYFKKTNFFIVL